MVARGTFATFKSRSRSIGIAEMYSVEYLPRLNQLSIEIVGNKLDAVTGIKVEEGKDISISIKSLDDPVKVRCPIVITTATPTSIKLQGTKLLICLKVDPQAAWQITSQAAGEESGPDKWSCGWLNKRTSKTGSKNEFQFTCSKCQSPLVDSLRHVFKDMPGDYWYELMDFWHCHKPDNNQPTDKDYGILTPKDDKTIVIGSFYLLETVNSSLQLIKENGVALYACKTCRQPIGDEFQSVIRLFKWKLNLVYIKDNQRLVSTYDPLLYAVNLFNTKMQSSAVRKFAIKVNQETLCCWIINTDIDVTIEGRILPKCLKIWWYSVAQGDKIDSSYEQTEILYQEVVDILLETLLNNTINSIVGISTINYQVSYIPSLLFK
ncbi:hypothetical protein KGF57_002534 [Candida theae]|uniref:Ubiquitin-conjugating enzyme E2C-binding protein n=1 Tax=Candida theae TaxID=1198502 RepID=A0AAD5BEK0_9ASCO|nr:uncharacterized protein KGF57_002534 [Candida theae]KAI5958179.1 hypothetical protein KGF57_002534 [Candida theae]